MSAPAKQHFAFLDGLRGLAALAVVWLHAAVTFDLPWVPIHAGLAVDFFFCLSGFVIAYAYDGRLCDGMRFGDFISRRLIRLYPLILFGAALGLAVKLGTGSPSGPATTDAIAAALLLPVGLADGRIPYPTNYPIWSLFFEILMSAAYGLLARWLSLRTIILLASGAGAVLIALTLLAGQVTGFGFKGTFHFLAGFVRVTYPFLLGVAVYRLGLHRGRGAPAGLLVAAVVAILFAPLGEAGWFEAAAVAVLLPALVILGARVPASSFDRLWSKLGDLSYPLYLVHLPILLWVAHFAFPNPTATAILASMTALGAAVIALKAYDEPTRAWLGGAMKGRSATSRPAVDQAGVAGE